MTISEQQKKDIEEEKRKSFSTKRTSVDSIEEKLFTINPVLDHGFIRVIDYMGDDGAIVQAARVSYGSGTKKSQDDNSLIRYLMRHWHSTPFEMCEIKFHIKLPVFVARQWIRHRTANVNEYSARYSILEKEFYIPEEENLASQSSTNNQGRGETLSSSESQKVLEILKLDSDRSYRNYESLLSSDGKSGLARELARMNLPTNIYTQWYWKTDLHNLFNFLRLRADSHAQYEIRVYAEVICDLVRAWVPNAYGAFVDYRLNSLNLSRQAVECLKRKLSGDIVNFEDSGMSKREWEEFTKCFEMR
ncbi:thymidylate synthase (FAD) [bacterium TMED277]|nr:MAG: thymidylate synthase (FAD) [bacterium TMED277]